MGAPEISAELSEPLDPFGYATHEVTNQPPPLTDYDAFGTDEVLKTIVRTFDAESYRSRLYEAGIVVGSGRVQELARSCGLRAITLLAPAIHVSLRSLGIGQKRAEER